MAGKPIEIPISVDAGDAEKGIKNVADSFEDLGDNLKDVSKDGDKAGKDLGDAFEKVENDLKGVGDASETAADNLKSNFDSAGKSVETTADKIDRDLTQALKEADNASDKAGKSIGTNIKQGTDEAGEGLANFKDEANSTAREAGASFDGSAEGIADAFQEVAANAFAGYGPAGAAAGLLIAVGIGVAIAKINEFAEANTEAKEEMAGLAKEIYKAGGALDDAAIAEKIEEIAFALSEEDNPWTPWANEAKTGIGEVRDAVGDLDRDLSKDIFKGLAGDTEAGQRAFDKLTESIERDKEALKGHQDVTEQGIPFYDEQGQKIKESIEKREALVAKLEEETGASKNAAAEAEYYKDVMGESSEAQERAVESTEKLRDAKQEIIDKTREEIEAEREKQDAIASSVSSELDYHDAIATLNEKLKENGATVDINTEKGRENQRAIIDQANAITQMGEDSLAAGVSTDIVTGKFQAQRDALINQVMPAFGGSREAAAKYIDQVLKTPKETITTVKLEGEAEVRGALDRLSRPVGVLLEPQAPTETYFQNVLSKMSGRSIPVSLRPVVDPFAP